MFHITETGRQRVIQSHTGRGTLHEGNPDPEGDILTNGKGIPVPDKGLVNSHIGGHRQGLVRRFPVVVQMGSAHRVIILVIIHIAGRARIPPPVRQAGVGDTGGVAQYLIRHDTVHQHTVKGDQEARARIRLKSRKRHSIPNICCRADHQVSAGYGCGCPIQKDIAAGD